MSALVKKEIRLLLPSFTFAIILALVSVFFHDREGTWVDGIGYFTGCIFCPAIVVMLALNTFGLEVGTHTFSMMLAQPVTRQRIWQTKILLLALALVAVGLVWYISVAVPALFFRRAFAPADLTQVLAVVIIFGVAVYTGGLWTVLLLRQVAAAFWFTLIVPGALLALVAAFCGGSSDEFVLGMVASVLGLYSVAGFFFARWLFFRAQDLQWTGGAIVMPEWRGLMGSKTVRANLRMWRPNTALWWKEIQLHQSQYVIAFSLAVLHLGVTAVRKFCDLQNSPDLKFMLENFWALWIAMPLLAGCAAVAEERKIGTHESQLCLPAKRRTQFAIKFLVMLGLSLVLGALVPLLLEGSRILPDVKLSSGNHEHGWESRLSGIQFIFWHSFDVLNHFLPFLTLAGLVALIGTISFYVSTMTRNTLQCLAPAVLGIMLALTVVFATAAPLNQMYYFLWSGPLGCLIVLPIMALALLALAFRNFQSVLTGWKMGACNLLALAAALVLGVVITSATYHRCWEKLTPFEPPHGAARLSLSNPVTLTEDWLMQTTHLPDGRIWIAPYLPAASGRNLFALMLGNFKVELGGGKYLPGTNWSTLQHDYWLAAGIKDDGTLWVSKNPPSRAVPPNDRWQVSEDRMSNLAQFGDETNWTSLLPLGQSLLLVKSDGTLWRLGTVDFDSRHTQWPGLLAFTPQRLGTNSDWAEVFQTGYSVCFRKKDGSGWMTGENWTTNGVAYVVIGPEPPLVAHDVPALARNQMRSTVLLSHGLTFGIGVRSDGTFRIWSREQIHQGKEHYGYYESWPIDQQIGTGTNWVAVAGNGERTVTLRNDGTLWLWDFRRNSIRNWNPNALEQEILEMAPVRLGTHSDWIAISGDSIGVTALAADGSLWYWPLAEASQFADFTSFIGSDDNGNTRWWLPLLDISRKPQLLGNVFVAGN